MSHPAPLNSPLWLGESLPQFGTLRGVCDVDVAVVGGGITGLTAAYLLKQAGKTVAVLESSRLGFGATGYTTAKLTVGHGLIYSELVESFGVEAARLYARSNQDAIEQVAAIVNSRGIECDFERARNYVYTEKPESCQDIAREAEAARCAGISADLTSDTDLRFAVAVAVRVDDQAQFHPVKYIHGLARLVDGEDSHVFELSRAVNVRLGQPCVVITAVGSVRARHVILATQLPILDRGLFFAKAYPMKSYAIAGTIQQANAPRGMYISIDQPTRSIRSAPAGNDHRWLIVGGEGHTPGTDTGVDRYQRLERFMQERFHTPAASHHWSTHDYVPLDKLPYIGRLRRHDDRVLVATGFAKWGMTKGTIAASILSDQITNRRNPYRNLYDSTRPDVRRSAGRFSKENAKVASHFFADRLRRRAGRHEITELRPGDGTVARIRGRHYAIYRSENGELRSFSARCTHLGCIVGWNAADRAWECPCHGSRFTAEGILVQGPATADLHPQRLAD
jgi:glycine/D-amino acid oxidase-like deaminating enzyme/nitrite reductase/ring-hydroxylating ferredoxin subunit